MLNKLKVDCIARMASPVFFRRDSEEIFKHVIEMTEVAKPGFHRYEVNLVIGVQEF